MLFSVIIPTCNRSHLLCNCLDLLFISRQEEMTIDYEVIITDDSIGNEARSMIETRYKWAKWVEGPKRGPAANRNNGVKFAKGEWLIFIDDDCLPDKNILNIYHNAVLANKNVTVFEGCIKANRNQQSLIEESPINESGGCLWSCNFMINKKLFLETLNGFDEKFPYATMEDVDLHYRLKKLHVSCFFLKDALVIHPWRLQRKLISVTVKRFRSTLYFLNKHPERKKDLNSLYYIRAFYHNFFCQTIKKSISYRFSGFVPKIAHDLLHLYFAVYLFLYNRKQ